MAAANKNSPKKHTDNENESSLRGTIVSVGFVGAVIVIMWAAIFGLYMSRI
ncbi:cytochrome c oxidase subunit 2A [Virgibacillus oceani]|uniref:Cytochrome c oxidase subunit 2A n=1 Tax=Virgibacillus oceani TaxID=1479511 RepID=A0A917HDL9_9BACI|nr:cytochrome c oxidase subunit 2A [Virgibacillus oceani]GGG75201.1 hypothetical protein GCM10011398_19980 [Virgibacillus oceani]